jgi:erythronate-4-phosphate dehydrogenase
MIMVVEDQIPFLRGIPEKFASVSYLSIQDFNRENIRDADVLVVRTPNKCTRGLLSGTSVKYIASTTSGFDHIDVEYCREAGIRWVNCPGCNAVSVGQYVLASLIELSRKEDFFLKEKVLGIIGVGNVGRQVERICKAYGMRCLLYDPPRVEKEGPGGFSGLQQITEECDIISFHVPLIKEGDYSTYHFAGDFFFRSLKKRPYIINAARGSIIDTGAIINAKKKGMIRGMIIDCWENEPAISTGLLSQALIATPHIAGFSADGKANGSRMCLEAIALQYNIKIDVQKYFTGPEPPENPVIDLNEFSGKRIENAILKTFSPLEEDKRLRECPDQFEYLRTHYNNPREFSAYMASHASADEAIILSEMGFRII